MEIKAEMLEVVRAESLHVGFDKDGNIAILLRIEDEDGKQVNVAHALSPFGAVETAHALLAMAMKASEEQAPEEHESGVNPWAKGGNDAA